MVAVIRMSALRLLAAAPLARTSLSAVASLAGFLAPVLSTTCRISDRDRRLDQGNSKTDRRQCQCPPGKRCWRKITHQIVERALVHSVTLA